MKLFFCFCAIFFSFLTSARSSQEEYQSFLRYEKQQKQFENRKKDILRERLQELEKVRSKKQLLKNHKAFVEYERKQKEFEKKRKNSFLVYKIKHKKYKQRQKSILETRLKGFKEVKSQSGSLRPSYSR